MQELSQILQHEQNNKEEIERIKQEVKDEIQKKKDEVALRLSKPNFLPVEEQAKIFSRNDKKKEELGATFQQRLKEELSKLEKTEKENTQKALDYLVQAFLDF